jgi:phage host-nuclease inhibitor protein Gam
MSEDIQIQLDMLADFQAKRDVVQLEKQELIDGILTPEIKAQIAEIEAEFAGRTEAVDESIKTLTDAVKAAVLERGEKVKGQFLQAVWSKGSASWDTKGLQGYAKAHPEVAEFYKPGNPYVSIRKV